MREELSKTVGRGRLKFCHFVSLCAHQRTVRSMSKILKSCQKDKISYFTASSFSYEATEYARVNAVGN